MAESITPDMVDQIRRVLLSAACPITMLELAYHTKIDDEDELYRIIRLMESMGILITFQERRNNTKILFVKLAS